MHSTDKLKDLMARCKCGVYVSVNEHRDVYESVEQYLADEFREHRDTSDWPPAADEMIAKDSVVRVQFYPETPIGFYVVYHWDLEFALDAALACFPDQSEGKV